MSIKLTGKQEQFALGVADGLSQADAYRAAYDTNNMKEATIHQKASLMMKQDKIRARVEELREALVIETKWSREDSVEELARIARDVARENKASERVSAIKELNAMHGFNAPAKLEVEHRGLKPITDEDWL